jgi:hypothetical protein
MLRQVGEKWGPAARALSRKRWLRSAILVVPPIGVLLLIVCFGRNTPFWDEWELVPIFQHLHAGHFYWQDFWQQHNEHRIPLPTLLLVGLAYLTHWNTQLACIVSLLVALGAFWLMRLAVLATAAHAGQRFSLLWLLPIALLWFSPGQFENWLWGWHLEWYMNLLGITLVVYGLAQLARGAVAVKWLLVALSGGLLAQYSLGNGTLAWPLLALAVLYLRRPVWQSIMVWGAGTLATVLYYAHYSSSMGGPSKLLAAHHPLMWVRYVLVYIGRPVSFLAKPALLLGFVLVLAFCGLSIYLVCWRRQLLSRAAPWLALGLYALGSAMITGIARLGFGIDEALSSRYTTISSLFLVSLLMLVWISRQSLYDGLRGAYRPAVTIAGIGVYGLVLINGVHGLHAAHGRHATLTAMHNCAQAVQPSDVCLSTTYPDISKVRPRLQYIKSLHWGGY